MRVNYSPWGKCGMLRIFYKSNDISQAEIKSFNFIMNHPHATNLIPYKI